MRAELPPERASKPSGDVRPRLAPFARLQWDPARERYVVLLPESVLVLNATGAAILTRCDGMRAVAAITEELRASYNDVADPEIALFLQRAAHRRLVVLDADDRAQDHIDDHVSADVGA
jgi:pyrroloquinoline quinone biosynthesis protein D